MSAEVEKGPDSEQGEAPKTDRFLDHFDSYNRRKILSVAAGYGGDLERLLLMLEKPKDREGPLTREELLSFLPDESRDKVDL